MRVLGLILTLWLAASLSAVVSLVLLRDAARYWLRRKDGR